jgi:hypothetical protein
MQELGYAKDKNIGWALPTNSIAKNRLEIS